MAEKETADTELTEEVEETIVGSKRSQKQRKVVRRRKSKKEKESPLLSALRLAVESGKVEFGARSSGKAKKKIKLLVVASNIPEELRIKVIAVAVPILEFEGSSIELGSACGCPFPVAVLSVFDAGASNLMELAQKKDKLL